MTKKVRIHCNQCGRETNHAVHCAHSEVWDDIVDDGTQSGLALEEKETFEIVQCLGCEEMAVRHSLEHEAHGQSVRFYPPRISRRAPVWKDKLPKQISAVIDEVYRALQTDSPRLASMGARTIIDLLILDKVGDVGSFAEKLEELEKQGYIASKNRRFIVVALEAGSAAAHRAHALAIKDLNKLMDIVESLLESTYILEQAAQRLFEVTPPRSGRSKKVH